MHADVLATRVTRVSSARVLTLMEYSDFRARRVNCLGLNVLIGHHFADDIFKCIFLNETFWILIKISMEFVPKSPINNIPALVKIMAWRRLGDKPLSELIMVSLLTHICVTRPQWVKYFQNKRFLCVLTYILHGATSLQTGVFRVLTSYIKYIHWSW